jgi:amino acid permease
MPASGAAGPVSAAVSLVLVTVGAGVLSFPYAASKAGTVVLTLLILSFVALAYYCDLILVEFTFHHRAALRHGGTFDELCALVLGRRHYKYAAAQVIFGLLGTLVGFLCVAGDLGVPAVAAACGGAPAGSASGRACAAFGSRAGVILTFAACVVMPLAGCARIHSLRASSAVGVGAVVAVVGLLVVRGAQAAPGGAAPAAAVPGWGSLLAAPIVLYAVGNHVQTVNVFLDASEATQRAFHLPLLAAFFVVAVLYVAAALGGAYAFGAPKGDVLLNFPLSDTAASCVKALMALHVCLVLPVDVVPLRRSVALALLSLRAAGAPPRSVRVRELLLQGRGDGSGDGAWGEGGGGGSDGDGEGGTPGGARARLLAAAAEEEAALPSCCGTPCSASIAAQTAAMVLGTAAVAVFFPQVNVVFGLLGATLGVTCMVLYPALFLLAKAAEVEGGRGGWGGPGSITYTPASPYWLRLQGRALVALSVALIVLGTGNFVWATWLA